MIKKPWGTILVALAICLASILRLFMLDRIPPGLHGDEALTGYTAFSLLKTGKDLVGVFHPLAFHDINMGGTFPPLLSYILIPFVKIFGLSPWVVRLPNALAGILSVYLIYRIVLSLTKREIPAIAAAFFLAVNPWSIHLSRQGQLESLAVTLVLSGIALYFPARKSPKLYIASGLFFGLSLFAYDAPRLFLPLFLPLLVWYEPPNPPVRRSFVIGSGICITFFLLFLSQLVWSGEMREYTRSAVVSKGTVTASVMRERSLSNAPQWMRKVLHNKYTVTIGNFMTNLFRMYSPNFLFLNGYGNIQESVANHGQFHLYHLPLFFIGWFTVFSSAPLLMWFLLLWMIAGSLPAALSNGNLVYRASLMMPVPLIVSSIGAVSALQWIRKRHPKKAIIILVAILLSMTVVFAEYTMTYFLEYPVYASEAWAKQQNEAIRYGVKNSSTYTSVFFDGNRAWANQYAFWERVEPSIFSQRLSHPVTVGGRTMYRFGNLYFGTLTDEIRRLASASAFFPPDSLVITIGADNVFPSSMEVARFPAPDGHATYKAVISEP